MNHEHKNLLHLDEELRSMAEETPEIHAGFHASWMRAVEEDMNNNTEKNEAPVKEEQKIRKFPVSTRWISVAAAMVLLVGGTAVFRDELVPRTTRSTGTVAGYTADTVAYGSSSSAYKSSSPTYAAEDSMVMSESSNAMYSMEESAAGEVSDTAVSQREQKIIRTVSMTLGTKNYDDFYASIRQRCTAAGGWIEFSSESGSAGHRSATITLRIPSEQLDSFVESLAAEGRTIRRSESATDVSESYYDTQTRLETQKALMERLRALMTDAADLSELLELEQQIASTQYTIDSLQSSLNSTDRKVNYATLDLSLKEESDAVDAGNTELSFFERILSSLKNGFSNFGNFLEDLAVFTVSITPILICIAVLILGIRMAVRKIRKNRKSKE